MSRTHITLGVVIVILFIVVILAFQEVNMEGNNVALDAFAQCLSDRGAVMYGTYSCPVCKKQKQLFGDSFRFIPYVECMEESDRCVANNIEKVPTWIFSNEKKAIGLQSFEALAAETSCSLPR